MCLISKRKYLEVVEQNKNLSDYASSVSTTNNDLTNENNQLRIEIDNLKKYVDDADKAINLGREEAFKEVLEWLEENFYTADIEQVDSYLPKYILNGNFESKEEMLQSFKERFNIE